MAFREVTMLEIKEILRLWLAGVPKKRIAQQLGFDVKTVRRYLAAARARGVEPAHGLAALDDELVAAVVAATQPGTGRPRGEGWTVCEAHREFIARPPRPRRAAHQGREASAPARRRDRRTRRCTASRSSELGFGQHGADVPVADCEPGEEVQVDTGWMTLLEPDALRPAAPLPRVDLHRRPLAPPLRLPGASAETTATAIEACEAAWEFFGGVFRSSSPTTPRRSSQKADPLEAADRATASSSTRRRATSTSTRPACAHAEGQGARRADRADRPRRLLRRRAAARPSTTPACALARWCLDEYGMRRHTPHAAPAARALRGRGAAGAPARADRALRHPDLGRAEGRPRPVRRRSRRRSTRCRSSTGASYLPCPRRQPDRPLLRRRQAREDAPAQGARRAGHRPRRLPGRALAYAQRDTRLLRAAGRRSTASTSAASPRRCSTARCRGRACAASTRCSASPARYGAARVDAACKTALDADMLDVYRLERDARSGSPPASQPPPAAASSRSPATCGPPSQYALPLARRERPNEGDDA